MIRRHDFNSDWWGKEVGIVSDRAFFDLPGSIQLGLLDRYDWVEFVAPPSALPAGSVLGNSGFFHVDTQVPFRLDLRKIELSQSGCLLEVESATESPFEIETGDVRPFLHERFCVLPGASEARVSARYRLWASRMVSEHPATALRLSTKGETQGWFLAEPRNNGLQLSLAMLSVRSRSSGYDLYTRAIAHFAELGYRLGFASFSVRNSSVLNIYSRLGAHFLEPRECWMWTPPEKYAPCD